MIFEKKKEKWYIIQVVSWTEEAVKSTLYQRRENFKLNDFILDIFIPTHDTINIRSWWIKVRRKKNIFPWYLLIKMIVTNESWYIVRNTPNVTWFLWSWNIPIPITDEEFNKIKWVLEKKSETFSTKYKIWDNAIITKWTFEWQQWIILEINEKKWCVKINLNILWRDTPVELDFWQIKIR